MREKELCMLKQMLELSDSNFRKFLKKAPKTFINIMCECLLNVINGNVPVNKQLLKKSRGLISAVIIKGNKSEEKAIYFGEKIRTYQGNSILMLPLLKSQIMHAEEFVLIPKRMFISKNPTKEEIFDNPIYQQKATQLSLLQRSNPNFEQSSGKKMLTQALID